METYYNECRKLFIENFLVISYSLAIIVALCYPLPGKFLYELTGGVPPFRLKIIEYINNVIIFLISGVQLKSEDLLNIRKYSIAIPYGLVMINFLTTLLAFGMVKLPYQTSEFPIGFAIFCTVPTTLGVGVALTTAAKGDQVLSLILTIVSNILGVITVPYLLQLYISGLSVTINPVTLFIRLIFSVFIPSIIGISARRFSTNIAKFVMKNKIKISMFSNLNLVCIVWMTLSSSRETILQQNGLEIFFVIVTSAVQHLIYLSINYCVAVHLLRFELKQAISITIMASQKSSPVALVVISIIAMSSSQAGLYVIPCVTGQLIQIFIGSLLAKYFARKVTDYEKVQIEEEKNDSLEESAGNVVESNVE